MQREISVFQDQFVLFNLGLKSKRAESLVLQVEIFLSLEITNREVLLL